MNNKEKVTRGILSFLSVLPHCWLATLLHHWSVLYKFIGDQAPIASGCCAKLRIAKYVVTWAMWFAEKTDFELTELVFFVRMDVIGSLRKNFYYTICYRQKDPRNCKTNKELSSILIMLQYRNLVYFLVLNYVSVDRRYIVYGALENL